MLQSWHPAIEVVPRDSTPIPFIPLPGAWGFAAAGLAIAVNLAERSLRGDRKCRDCGDTVRRGDGSGCKWRFTCCKVSESVSAYHVMALTEARLAFAANCRSR